MSRRIVPRKSHHEPDRREMMKGTVEHERKRVRYRSGRADARSDTVSLPLAPPALGFEEKVLPSYDFGR